jgi:hypothetical protein
VRISFDMDGVLADMDAALARIAEQEFGVTAKAPSGGLPSTSLRPGKPPGYDGRRADEEKKADEEKDGDTGGDESQGPPPGYEAAVLSVLSARQQTRLWQRVRDTRNFWETLGECEPGTVRRLQKLAHELRWDVLFVTQRPSSAGRTPQLQSQHWLRRHGFEYPAVYITQGSRGRIAASLTLDAHIDDRLDNCVDVTSDSKAWPILVWRDAESFGRIRAGATNLGIAVVRTVGEALDKIEQADRAASQQEQPTLLDRLRRAFK